MTTQESKKLELHQQRAANLQAELLKAQMGARILAEVPVEQLVDEPQVKDGAA